MIVLQSTIINIVLGKGIFRTLAPLRTLIGCKRRENGAVITMARHAHEVKMAVVLTSHDERTLDIKLSTGHNVPIAALIGELGCV
jgi:hypothetical protein